MRKFLGVAAIVFVLLAPAGAAAAQQPQARDPFAPLIRPEPVPTDGGTGVPTDPTVPVDPVDPTDPLPTTGSSTTTWVGLGYVLVALGTGAVVLSKVFRPVRVASR